MNESEVNSYLSIPILERHKLSDQDFADFHRITACREIDRVLAKEDAILLRYLEESLEEMLTGFAAQTPELLEAQKQINAYFRDNAI